uniref:Ovule protein n=1 Tax=Romanomermis culicivorax TaxID=13658 RepID=A0A915HLM5_ROMCU
MGVTCQPSRRSPWYSLCPMTITGVSIQLNKSFPKTYNMLLPHNWSPICKLDSKLELNRNDRKNM